MFMQTGGGPSFISGGASVVIGVNRFGRKVELAAIALSKARLGKAGVFSNAGFYHAIQGDYSGDRRN
jgi:hypothetical protein